MVAHGLVLAVLQPNRTEFGNVRGHGALSSAAYVDRSFGSEMLICMTFSVSDYHLHVNLTKSNDQAIRHTEQGRVHLPVCCCKYIQNL